MKKLSTIIAGIVLAFGVSNSAFADGDNKTASHNIGIKIDQFALLDIESSSSNNIRLDPVAPTEAGLGVNFSGATNSDLWLNYSSIVNDKKTRSISAKIDGTLPGGTTISVAAAKPSGEGKGTLGTAVTTAQTLTTGGITVISGIGSCYTGNGDENGSNLTYKLNLNETSYGELLNGNYSVTITYTISDEQ